MYLFVLCYLRTKLCFDKHNANTAAKSSSSALSKDKLLGGGGEGEEHKTGSQSWEEGKMAEGRAGWGWSQALTDLQFYLN